MARQTRPLTATEVKNAKAADKAIVLYDGSGLELQITSSGSKLWRFRYYKPHSQKRAMMSFGSYPVVTLADTRVLRENARSLLAKYIDPLEEQRASQEKTRRTRENTFKSVATNWYELKKAAGLKPHTLQDIWNSLNRYVFPHIGEIGIDELTAQQVIAALEPCRAGGKLETVKRMTQRINEVVDYAMNAGLIVANPVARVRRAFPRPVVRHRPSLSPEQLPELMRALSVASIRLQTRCLIEWQLLTMCRPSEASGARWSELDMKAREWRIPEGRMKMQRQHIIPLSEQAMRLLEVMKPISQHGEFIFPALGHPKKPMNSQTANMELKRMGFKGLLVAHGMRAIASTTLNEAGFSPDVIESALAHMDTNEVRRAYNRANYLEQRRQMMVWWGNYVDRAATGRFGLSCLDEK